MAKGYDEFFRKPLSNKLLISISLILAFILAFWSLFYVTKSHYQSIVTTVGDTRYYRYSGIRMCYGFPLPWIGEDASYERISYVGPYEHVFYVFNPFSFMFDWIFWLIIASTIVFALNRYGEPKYLVGKLWVPLLFILIFLGLSSLHIAFRTVLFILWFAISYVLLHSISFLSFLSFISGGLGLLSVRTLLRFFQYGGIPKAGTVLTTVVMLWAFVGFFMMMVGFAEKIEHLNNR